MRTILIITLLLAIVLPCSAEITQQDLEKISNLMDRKLEPIKIDIATMKVELKLVKEELKAMKGELKTLDDKVTALDSKLAVLGDKTTALENKMATKDDIIAVRKNLTGRMATKDDIIAMRENLTGRMDTLYGVLIGILVAIIVAILTIIFTPNLKKWLGRREQTKDEKRFQRIEAEIEAIKKAEEARKETARRIVEENPEFEEAYRLLGLL